WLSRPRAETWRGPEARERLGEHAGDSLQLTAAGHLARWLALAGSMPGGARVTIGREQRGAPGHWDRGPAAWRRCTARIDWPGRCCARGGDARWHLASARRRGWRWRACCCCSGRGTGLGGPAEQRRDPPRDQDPR